MRRQNDSPTDVAIFGPFVMRRDSTRIFEKPCVTSPDQTQFDFDTFLAVSEADIHAGCSNGQLGLEAAVNASGYLVGRVSRSYSDPSCRNRLVSVFLLKNGCIGDLHI